jgi:hypothetical protein
MREVHEPNSTLDAKMSIWADFGTDLHDESVASGGAPMVCILNCVDEPDLNDRDSNPS